MTVGELRKMLEGVADNMTINAYDGEEELLMTIETAGSASCFPDHAPSLRFVWEHPQQTNKEHWDENSPSDSAVTLFVIL